MQVEFYLAGETTQVLDAIPWVRCASGNVSFAARPRQLGFYKCFQLTIVNKAVTQFLLLSFINVIVLFIMPNIILLINVIKAQPEQVLELSAWSWRCLPALKLPFVLVLPAIVIMIIILMIQ